MSRLLTAMSGIDGRFEHMSIAHMRVDSRAPIVATTSLARTMATEQLLLGEGGLCEALHTALPSIVTAGDRPRRFPPVQPTAQALEVDLQLAVPVLHGDHAVGALSIYSTTTFDVDISMLEAAQALAAQAELTVRQDLLAGDLRVGMQTRQQIGQACGILMSRFLLASEQAFAALRRASQNRNIRVRDLATEVIRTGTLAELDADR